MAGACEAEGRGADAPRLLRGGAATSRKSEDGADLELSAGKEAGGAGPFAGGASLVTVAAVAFVAGALAGASLRWPRGVPLDSRESLLSVLVGVAVVGLLLFVNANQSILRRAPVSWEVIRGRPKHIKPAQREPSVNQVNEANAAVLEDLQRKFLAGISHELRTPLNAVIAFNTLLLESELNTTQREFVRASLTSADALLGLVSQLLEHAKLDAGSGEPVTLMQVPFRVFEIANEVLDIVGTKAVQSHVEFVVDADPSFENMRVIGDPFRLRQCLTSLADNGIKFTKENGVVTLSANIAACPRGAASPCSCCRRATENGELEERTQGRKTLWVEFKVTDTGIGIPPENQPLLFRPFTQLPGPQGEKAQGVGIGLSLCKQVIEAMGGTISVSSALGHGSTFELRVPFAVEASPAAPAAAEEAQAAAEAALEEVATTLPRSMVVCVAIATPQLRAAVRRSVEGWGASVFETDVPCEPASACHRGSVSDVSDQPLRPGNRASLGSVGSVAPAAEIPAADAADLDEVLRCITAAADVAPGGHVLLIVEAPQLRWLVRRGFAFEDNSVQPVVLGFYDEREELRADPPPGLIGTCLPFVTKPVRQADLRDVLLTLVEPAKTLPELDWKSMHLSRSNILEHVMIRPRVSDESGSGVVGAAPSVSGGERLGGVVEDSAQSSSASACAALPHAARVAFTMDDPHSTGAAGASPLSVLVVEDNLLNQKVALAVLNRCGIKAVVANNGQEAVDMIEAGEKFSLILMDVQMPVMDGVEATRRIRQYEIAKLEQALQAQMQAERDVWDDVDGGGDDGGKSAKEHIEALLNGSDTPAFSLDRQHKALGVHRSFICALTANASAEDRIVCLKAGMNDYVTKPIHPHIVRDKINRLRGNTISSDDPNAWQHACELATIRRTSSLGSGGARLTKDGTHGSSSER